MNIIQATTDPNLFASWFRKRDTWQAWFAFLAALFALPMTDEQLAIYRQCTGRDEPPTEAASEGWLVIGRRGGKSYIMALCAVFLACFREYRQYLAPGERGTVLVIARDRKQARVILRYVRALLVNVPMLARMVEREWAEGFDLSNSTCIEVATASFRSVRGYTVLAALLDELAFWPSDDAADPDFEIINAIKPAMATIPGAMMLCASSPYARRGALWQAHQRYFGKPGPVLVWQAPTRTMNSSVPQRVIDEATERDPASAAAEFGAQFRSDIEAFVSREAVLACVAPGVRERPKVIRTKYSAFVDPSGGSADSFTLAIGHRDGDVAVLDALREVRPKFSPEQVVEDFSVLLKSYGIARVVGDRYAGEWPREQFRKRNITYEPSAAPKSDIYRDVLAKINSRKVDLLDDDRLINQFVGLERRVGSQKDRIDHAPGAHDDLCNAAAGCLLNVGTSTSFYSSYTWVNNGGPDYAQSRRNAFVLSGGRVRF